MSCKKCAFEEFEKNDSNPVVDTNNLFWPVGYETGLNCWEPVISGRPVLYSMYSHKNALCKNH